MEIPRVNQSRPPQAPERLRPLKKKKKIQSTNYFNEGQLIYEGKDLTLFSSFQSGPLSGQPSSSPASSANELAMRRYLLDQQRMAAGLDSEISSLPDSPTLTELEGMIGESASASGSASEYQYPAFEMPEMPVASAPGIGLVRDVMTGREVDAALEEEDALSSVHSSDASYRPSRSFRHEGAVRRSERLVEREETLERGLERARALRESARAAIQRSREARGIEK